MTTGTGSRADELDYSRHISEKTVAQRNDFVFHEIAELLSILPWHLFHSKQLVCTMLIIPVKSQKIAQIGLKQFSLFHARTSP